MCKLQNLIEIIKSNNISIFQTDELDDILSSKNKTFSKTAFMCIFDRIHKQAQKETTPYDFISHKMYSLIFDKYKNIDNNKKNKVSLAIIFYYYFYTLEKQLGL